MKNSVSNLIDELFKHKNVNVTFCADTVQGVKDSVNGYIQKSADEPLSLWKAYHNNCGYLAGFETVHDAFRAIQLVDELKKRNFSK